ncbi:amidinotransferase [Thalassotalea euphylliae]|uniref:Amidinotransferase n=2 Tax=Thalassotalea euphylliae TaxID=1655234 RepID=A0A3E0U9Q8_9GAMM|nr:amidinotransferase [Thalassotalea euphylliae]
MQAAIQAPKAVVMVRPHQFKPNPQTANDNTFQVNDKITLSQQQIAKQAFDEVSQVANKLSTLGVKVHLFEDKMSNTPDAVFPNNWFSTHSDGHFYLYPMYAENRRLEKRHDIIEHLIANYQVDQLTDLSCWEQKQQFLEGTGVLVIDHLNHLVYVTRSKRADEAPLMDFCHQQNLSPVFFNATDRQGKAVYHTNVLMCVTTGFVIIADEMIRDNKEREQVLKFIHNSGKTHISLSEIQINQFAGNMLELSGSEGRFIAMSTTAYRSLSKQQIAILSEKARIETFDIPTVEMAGGSIRCMLAGIHLTPSKKLHT